MAVMNTSMSELRKCFIYWQQVGTFSGSGWVVEGMKGRCRVRINWGPKIV